MHNCHTFLFQFKMIKLIFPIGNINIKEIRNMDITMTKGMNIQIPTKLIGYIFTYLFMSKIRNFDIGFELYAFSHDIDLNDE